MSKLKHKLPVMATFIMATAGVLIGCETNKSEVANKEGFYSEEVREAFVNDLSGKVKEYMAGRNITTTFTKEDVNNIKEIVVKEVETNYVFELTPELKAEVELLVENIFNETAEGYFESSDVDSGLKTLVVDLTKNLMQSDEDFKKLLESSEEEIKTVQTSLLDVESRLKGVEDEIKPYSKPDTEVSKLNTSVKDFETAFNTYKQETDQKLSNLKGSSYNTHTDEIAAFESSYELFKTGMDQIINSLKAQVKALNDKDVLNEEETNNLKESYANLRTSLSNTAKSLSENKTADELLSKALNELKGKVDKNIVSLAEINSKIDNKATDNTVENNITSLQTALTQLKEYVEKTVDINISTNKSSIEVNSGKISANANNILLNTTAIATINNSLDGINATLNNLKSADEENAGLKVV